MFEITYHFTEKHVIYHHDHTFWVKRNLPVPFCKLTDQPTNSASPLTADKQTHTLCVGN